MVAEETAEGETFEHHTAHEATVASENAAVVKDEARRAEEETVEVGMAEEETEAVAMAAEAMVEEATEAAAMEAHRLAARNLYNPCRMGKDCMGHRRHRPGRRHRLRLDRYRFGNHPGTAWGSSAAD